jgi:membrane protease YdiL (CAAX protease family)
MIGILLLLTCSYLVLRWYNQSTGLPSLFPYRRLTIDLLIGTFPLLYYCCLEWLIAYLVKNPYQLNPAFTLSNFIESLGYIARSVMFEELIFRGILFYLIWKKWGSRLAIIISAICFGVYHWFSWQAFGNPVQMLIIFLSTSSVGLILGYAFVRTKYMFLPISLHFFTNIANMLIFSKDQTLGPQLLVKAFKTDPVAPSGFIGIPMLLLYFCGYQCFTFLLVYRYTNSRNLDVK